MSKKTINVSIALLFHKNQVLVGWREASLHQGGKAEFPGGKVELGETPEQACQREVQEEVGIFLDHVYLFDVITHEYEDLIVKLHIYQAYVDQSLLDHIQSPWTWHDRSALSILNFPKANDAIVKRLLWPKKIAIKNIDHPDTSVDLNQVSYLRTENALDFALQHNQNNQLDQFIINRDVWIGLSKSNQKKVFAVQFKHAQLMQLNSDSFMEEWKGIKRIASCHDHSSVSRAVALGFDAIFLSPVLCTTSHPQQAPLGWTQFELLSKDIHIPVYALGGMKPELLDQAIQHGAYGIAGIRAF
ncbi:thiamine phosphate synthase [Acinetobacter sp. Ver3]|uniref:thiamine phosphate synthase n=1 Tax=Acinetobacter sp. Ver3 TaxID=466088 RepID=UPI0004474581|nr:thiamine phosphate synthase [Acinetobacter sp. Ver3]EZQ09996.1 dGTP-pyrophosphohydrolase [Acinetobacter sp. Ver3]